MGIAATLHVEGPVFDGIAEAAMHDAATAIRRRLAEEGKRLTVAAFGSQIRSNHGVFLSTITTTDVSKVYAWTGNWTRDIDTGSGGSEHVTRVYTMPVVVTDPTRETVVTTELAMYGPWLEGTGSRNETTRFRGYHGFRLAAQALDANAEAIGEAEIKPYVDEANG